MRVGLGIVFYLARRYEEAIEQAKIGLSLETDFFPARVLLGKAYLQHDRLAEGVAELQRLLRWQVFPGHWAIWATLTGCRECGSTL